MKYFNKIKFVCAVGVALMAVGCTSEEFANSETDDAMTFKAYLGDAIVSRANQLYLSQWINNTKVGIANSDASVTLLYKATNASENLADIVPNGQNAVWGNNEEKLMRAWVKNNGTEANSTTATNPSGTTHFIYDYNTSSDLDKSTFLYAYNTVSRADNVLYFYHQTTRLTFKLYNDPNENFFSKGEITGLAVNVDHNAVWTQPASESTHYGTWSAHADKGPLAAAPVTSSTSTLAEFCALVIPKNYTHGVTVDLESTRGDYSLELPKTYTNWLPGYHYIYTIKMHAGYAEITNVNVTLAQYNEDTEDYWQSEQQNVSGYIPPYEEAESNIFE